MSSASLKWLDLGCIHKYLGRLFSHPSRPPRRTRGGGGKKPPNPQVKTDDSFTFARAIKRLRQAIEALGDVTGGGKATDGTAGEVDEGEGGGAAAGGGGGDVSLSLERKTAIILIMKEAFRSYHLAWARSSIEPAFKVRAVQPYTQEPMHTAVARRYGLCTAVRRVAGSTASFARHHHDVCTKYASTPCRLKTRRVQSRTQISFLISRATTFGLPGRPCHLDAAPGCCLLFRCLCAHAAVAVVVPRLGRRRRTAAGCSRRGSCAKRWTSSQMPSPRGRGTRGA